MGDLVIVRESEFSLPPEVAPVTKPAGREWTVLFLSADPTNEARLRLGKEAREIENRLALGKHTTVRFVTKSAVRPSDITQAILDVKPDVVHFSGHGAKTGELCVEDENGKSYRISVTAVADLFELCTDTVKCVLLNVCHSEIQAKAISKHIPHVIGMNRAIGDTAAIVFATGFYKALAGGESFIRAFKFGRVELKLLNIPEDQTPVLFAAGLLLSQG